MNSSRSSILFPALILAAALFVVLTSQDLPPVLASHFDGAGAANGFMTRNFYIGFMLVFVVGLPLLLVYLPRLVFRNPQIPINLPHRDYWLAPERRQETVDFLCRHTARFGVAQLLLLCYVHWLVVEANAQVPARLSSPWLIGGLLIFVVASIGWSLMLIVHFRKIPRQDA